MTVTYDASCGYIGSVPGLRQPVVALSLGGLRRRIEIAMLPDESASSCSSMASPSANATAARHRRNRHAEVVHRLPLAGRAYCAGPAFTLDVKSNQP